MYHFQMVTDLTKSETDLKKHKLPQKARLSDYNWM